jgi:hypothetical protein
LFIVVKVEEEEEEEKEQLPVVVKAPTSCHHKHLLCNFHRDFVFISTAMCILKAFSSLIPFIANLL